MRLINTFFFSFCLLHILSAQGAKDFVIEHTIASKVFPGDRKVTVYLPPAFYRYPDDKYTVTYVLDGQYAPFIEAVTKTIAYNVNANKITPTIVVGVHSQNRGREFSEAMRAGDATEGRAPVLQQHFREEIFPLIDSIYPGLEDYRSLIGHSSGGHFVLFTLFGEQADLFDGYLALSPALRPGSNRILQHAQRKLHQNNPIPKFLYCSSGTVGEREELFGNGISQLDSLLETFPGHQLSWHPQRFAGFDHWSVVMPSVVDGLLAQTRTFRVDEKLWHEWSSLPPDTMLARVNVFYERASSVYGFKEIPSAGYLHGVAEEIARKGRTDQALAIYEWGMKQHPDNYFLTKYQADTYVDAGQRKAALDGYRKCLGLLPVLKKQVNEQQYAAYKEDLTERIAELE